MPSLLEQWLATISSKNFLTSAAIYISAIVGILTILDWLLGAKQKKWLTSFFETLWIWLALQRSGNFIRVLRLKTLQIGIAVFGISLIFIGQSYIIAHHPGFHISQLYTLHAVLGTSYILILTFILTYSLLRIYLNFLARSTVTWRYLLKLIITSELIADFYGVVKIWAITSGLVSFSPDLVSTIHGSVFTQLLFFSIFAPIEIFSQEVLRIQWFSIAWVLLILMLMSVIRIAQFFVYKIATYEKGPVLALSALLGGFAALLKAVG